MSTTSTTPRVPEEASDASLPFARRTLGRTGRTIHPLGVAASFGVGGADLEAAVEEHGVGYLYWGSMRTRAFAGAIRALTARGRRDDLFVVVQSYSRLGSFVRPSLCWALRRLGIERADLLLLGWWNKAPSRRILDAALRCRDAGLTAHVGVSTHERPLAAKLAAPGSGVDVIHFRYNAAHRGAEKDIFPGLAPREERAGLVAFTATRWGQLLRPVAGGPEGSKTPTAGDCYRFALSNDWTDVCITGARDGAELRHALDAMKRGPMDADEKAWIEGVGDVVYRGGGVRGRLGDAF